MKRIAFLASVAATLAAAPVVSMAASVTIAGSHSTSAYTTSIDTSVLYEPNSGPISATGTMDLSGLGSGVLFVGLISKIDFDHHNSISSPFFPDFKFFVDTAYASFNASSPRAGLGQYLQSGELTQTSVAGVTNPITSFEASFGDTSMSVTVQGNSSTLNYNFNPDTLTFTSDGSPYTDFSEGAYAFVGTFGGDTTFDVTFDGPEAVIPLPAALPLFGTGVVLLGALAGWKRRASHTA